MRTETHLHFCRRVCTLSQRERILAKTTRMRRVCKRVTEDRLECSWEWKKLAGCIRRDRMKWASRERSFYRLLLIRVHSDSGVEVVTINNRPQVPKSRQLVHYCQLINRCLPTEEMRSQDCAHKDASKLKAVRSQQLTESTRAKL